MNHPYDLIVVGGGASGLMAAGRAGERGLRVLLLEKNGRLGEKLRISGGGRCNITNAEENERTFLMKYGKAEPFLYPLFAQFGVQDTFEFFATRHLPLKVEVGKRAFPHTEDANDVVRVLETYMCEGGVEVHTQAEVTRVVATRGTITAVHCGQEIYVATDYLFATGSVSHPETGSTGDGFRWLRELGHTIAEPTPSVVPLAVREQWAKDLAGVTLPAMKITFFVDGKRAFGLSGKLLFTHFGISGPLILNCASRVADLLHTGVVTATVDVYPETDLGTLGRTLVGAFDAYKNKALKSIIKEIVPSGMQKGILTLLSGDMDVSTKVHSVTKEERKHIAHLLKALPMTIKGLMGMDRAVVADGGLPLTEIDMKTMRSRKVHNLMVTGDMLHINRPSGGYSLQLCWSTGYAAGSHAGEKQEMTTT